METFLITIAVLHLLKAGAFLSKRPGEECKPYTAGGLLYAAALNCAIAGFAIYFLTAA